MQAVKNVSRTYTEVTVDGSGRCRRAEQTGSDRRGDFRPVADDVRTHTHTTRPAIGSCCQLGGPMQEALTPLPEKKKLLQMRSENTRFPACSLYH